MTNTIAIVATIILALWVLFSGGTPFWKHLLFRVSFMGWGVVSYLVAHNVMEHYGIAPAVIAFIGLFLSWQIIVGPIIIQLLSMRRLSASN